MFWTNLRLQERKESSERVAGPLKSRAGFFFFFLSRMTILGDPKVLIAPVNEAPGPMAG